MCGMIDKKNVINFDFQGWPIEKMFVREFVKNLGFVLNPETNKWELPDTDQVMNAPIVTLEDDGMGYGVREMYITEMHVSDGVNAGEQGKICYAFREKEISYPSVWLEHHVHPGMSVTLEGDDTEWILVDIDETDDGFVFIAKSFPTGGSIHANRKSIPADVIKKMFCVNHG